MQRWSPKAEAFGSLSELKAAAVDAGLSCPDWEADNAVANAAESGECSDDSIMSTYASRGDLQAQLAQEKKNNALMLSLDIETTPILVGPNWLIKSPEAAELRAVMGGTLIGAKKPQE